ncbi:hypothetical protein PRK78_003976 [Emydomyces testavorans]|uniref:Uncharacterized protein n=1 Tax=Emydomyces testavorans TaxID=2070801 RepID=A0AAF0DHV9_9EURO|nr:hypothetical protein PRK78_003976 [Emydomyces testavorans]
MDEMPSDADNDLLQRLNALKPSTVQLEFRKTPCDFSDEDDDGIDVLSARSRDLWHSSSGFESYGRHEPSYAVPDQQGKEAEEEDVEDLLAELRTRETWKLEHELEAENEIKNLVDEAKKFVLSSSAAPLPNPQSDCQSQLLRGGDEAISKRLETPSRTPVHVVEEKEAEDYVRRVLDELRTPDSLINDGPVTKESPENKSQHGDSLDATEEQGVAKELNDSLNLPSVPTFNPTSSKKPRNIFTTPDESDQTWCCICSDDANVRCLNCDETPLFCHRCWKEMHLVEGSEEERKHRALELNRTAAMGA